MSKPTVQTPPQAFPSDEQDLRPVCFPARLHSLPGIPVGMLGFTPLPPEERSTRQLLAELRAAPQFAQIDPKPLLTQRRGGIGIIILTESDYCARQAAMYLAALALRIPAKAPQKKVPLPDDFAWLEEEEADNRLKNVLAVASPDFLIEQEEARSGAFSAPALLVTAPSGPVLSQKLLDILPLPLDVEGEDNPKCIFIALHPQQVDLELMEQLRFSVGYHVCRVGAPDQAYLRRSLTDFVTQLLGPPAPGFDPDQVIAALRQYRGADFDELDLERAVLWAVQRKLNRPATTQDLIFRPVSLGSRAREQLENMVGLADVKAAAERLTARLLLEQRRSMAGRPMAPACRNLAFSGPPGTGKSVTARLLAQLLREESVGTGRFVEAGREQLIGSYLGQTSPKVAELFEKARGGVLFIDEAGALLTRREEDCYAVEAVNALVRHMELEPETMVIFATYPQEMEQLLSSNPGLSSRVAQVLDFPAYSDSELWDILGALARREGDTLPPEAEAVCLDFFSRLRRRKGAHFGNGREARRLFQAAVEELALRLREDPQADTLTLEDLTRAARRLLDQPEVSPPAPIGF